MSIPIKGIGNNVLIELRDAMKLSRKKLSNKKRKKIPLKEKNSNLELKSIFGLSISVKRLVNIKKIKETENT